MTTIETCLFVGLAVLGVVQIIFGIGLDRLADRVERLEEWKAQVDWERGSAAAEKRMAEIRGKTA